MHAIVCVCMCIPSTSSLLMFVSASKIHRQRWQRRKHIVMVKRNSTQLHVCILSKSTVWLFMCVFFFLFSSVFLYLMHIAESLSKPSFSFIFILTTMTTIQCTSVCVCVCVCCECVPDFGLCCIVCFCIEFVGKFM